MKNGTIGATFIQRSQPGTVWCLYCARVGMHTVAVGTVDDDPCRGNCAPRQASLTGCKMIPLLQVASTPAPIEPPMAVTLIAPVPEVQKRTEIVPPVVTETPAPPSKEKPMPVPNKLTSADKAAIRAADPSITDQELADKYGVSNGAIWYQRNKAVAKPEKKSTTAPKKAAKVASQLPPPISISTARITTDPLSAILARMTEDQVDAAWSTLALADKTAAMHHILIARLGA